MVALDVVEPGRPARNTSGLVERRWWERIVREVDSRGIDLELVSHGG
jgi:hypothetical protein